MVMAVCMFELSEVVGQNCLFERVAGSPLFFSRYQYIHWSQVWVFYPEALQAEIDAVY